VLAIEKLVVKKMVDVVAREACRKRESGANCPIVGRFLLLAVSSVDSTESSGDS
jgi:flavoprotein